jgi:hypothetical protein
MGASAWLPLGQGHVLGSSKARSPGVLSQGQWARKHGCPCDMEVLTEMVCPAHVTGSGCVPEWLTSLSD